MNSDIARMDGKNDYSFMCSVKDIAAWSVVLPGLEEQHGQVVLPNLQRGAVWKPHQIEILWDSILRGFPIGSFLLARYEEDRGKRSLLYADDNGKNTPQYHLLDGQQRANTITLPFNLWDDAAKSTKSNRPDAALWIDLCPPTAGDQLGREFVFRVITRSHP